MIMIYNIEVCLNRISLKITDAHKRLKEKDIYYYFIVKVIVIFEDI